jgi:hypothetical protein
MQNLRVTASCVTSRSSTAASSAPARLAGSAYSAMLASNPSTTRGISADQGIAP